MISSRTLAPIGRAQTSINRITAVNMGMTILPTVQSVGIENLPELNLIPPLSSRTADPGMNLNPVLSGTSRKVRAGVI
jgi:hypothetical protein